MYSYNNMFYPGMFNRWGMNPWYYPGSFPGIFQGGGVMGKPNVYVHAPQGTKFEIKMKFPQQTNLLAAAPVLGKTGWKGTVKGPYQLQVGKAEWGMLYFDYRFNPRKLQSKRGFCSGPKRVVKRMSTILKEAGFEPYELKDFNQYWALKMPPADEYCVFPQDSRHLDAIAPFEVKPAPRSVVRINFMVMPRSKGSTDKPFMFHAKPTKTWTPALKRDPAAKTGLTVREWGVGFLVQKD